MRYCRNWVAGWMTLLNAELKEFIGTAGDETHFPLSKCVYLRIGSELYAVSSEETVAISNVSTSLGIPLVDVTYATHFFTFSETATQLFVFHFTLSNRSFGRNKFKSIFE